jgi:hypothetical protein
MAIGYAPAEGLPMITAPRPAIPRLPILLALAFCLLAAGPLAAQKAGANPAGSKPSGSQPVEAAMPQTKKWAELERLADEALFEQAAQLAATLRADALAHGDQATATRALIREVQQRTALDGFATALGLLLRAEPPADPQQQLLLHLFRAAAIGNYADAYGWEIRQREAQQGADPLDVERWTLDQVQVEIDSAFARAWLLRGRWGEGSLGALAEFVEPNGYPPHIRGTLRDAVTYLWAAELANSARWSPADSQSTHLVPLAELLADAEPAPADAAFADPGVHPLRKLRWVLADLEAWHRDRGRPEAAFEARLELLRHVRQHLDQDADLATLQADLERRLERLGRGLPWWSMGMALLAEWQGQGSGADAALRAHATASAGAAAHPRSPGGRASRDLVDRIEAPNLELVAMRVDGPGKASVEVRHGNVRRLHFRAYAFDLVAALRAAGAGGLQLGDQGLRALMRARKPAASWQVDLPQTGDFRVHRTLVTPPLTELGAYWVVASEREDFATDDNLVRAMLLQISDLVLLQKLSPDGATWEGEVRSGATGAAVEGADIALLASAERYATILQARTDAEGRVALALGDWNERPRGTPLVTFGADRMLAAGELYRPRIGEPQDLRRSLIYTDRSIYRPGQKLKLKVVAFEGQAVGGKGERWRIAPGQKVEIQLRDANGEEVAKLDLKTNTFGSASGEIAIPTGRLLGAWSLGSSWGGWASVRVEEYKRPTFEVAWNDPEQPLQLNREARVAGSARYYFGLPVRQGAVRWRVYREPVIPFGWWWPAPSQIRRQIASGEAALDAEGRFEAVFTPEADPRLAEGANRQISYRYLLEAELTDEGGETREASRAFHAGFVSIQAELRPLDGLLLAGRTARVELFRRDLDGQPRAGQGSYRVLRLASPQKVLLPADLPIPLGAEAERFATPGDRRRPRHEAFYDPIANLRALPDGAEVAQGELEHGADGKATLALDLAAGSYRVRYQTRDPHGALVERQVELVVAAPRASPPLPLYLATAESQVPAGGTLRFAAGSGIADLPVVVEIYRGEERLERLELAPGAGLQLVERPVTAADRGRLLVRAYAVRDHQFLQRELLIEVPRDDLRLALELSTFRDRLRPGQRETWTLKVAREDGAPLEPRDVEVLGLMFDRSLDLFAQHGMPDPLNLFSGTPRPRSWQSSLGSSWSSVWIHRNYRPGTFDAPGPDRLKFFDQVQVGGPGVKARGMAFLAEPQAAGLPAPAPPPVAEVPEQAADAVVTASGVAGGVIGVANASAANTAPPEPAEAPRSNFAETAFFEPHLLLADDGSAAFEFTVPESVTSWHVWFQAIDRQVRSGQLRQRAETVKELLVRPYLPRFLREGDRVELRVAIDNAGQQPLAGTLDFDLLDPATGESVLARFGLTRAEAQGRPFAVAVGGSETLVFALKAPPGVGEVDVRVMGRAGDFSDGELRPLPLLPARLHLTQSRFAALRDRTTKELVFEDLRRGDDPTLATERMTVTLDGQLFENVLRALPYLVDYPYRCTEQTLNRFVSSGIVSALFERHPPLAAVAKRFAEQRATPREAWGEAEDAGVGQLLLEETPWLASSRGGTVPEDAEVARILDPAVAAEVKAGALQELAQGQLPSGAFSWFPGGPPSTFMTLYLLQGLGRAQEMGVEVPRPMIERAWTWLRQEHAKEFERLRAPRPDGESPPYDLVWLAYVASIYPDLTWTGGALTEDDRRVLLDAGMRAWKAFPPRVKAYLALALARAGRLDEARRVFAPLMDAAKTSEQLGTYWQPEARSWLFYYDTLETHALALRTLTEVMPEDERRHGLVQWLLLNKQLNQWHSTRATAEVIYSLVRYLEQEGLFMTTAEARVEVGGEQHRFVFAPDGASSRHRVVLEGADVEPRRDATIKVEQTTRGLLFASATWQFATDRLPDASRGDLLQVERRYFRRVEKGGAFVLEPLGEGVTLAVGDQVEVELEMKAGHEAEYVHLRDPRGAGFEPETLTSGWEWQLGVAYYQEVRDSGANFFLERVPAGTYTFRYRLRAATAGTFRVGPAQLQSMYAPDFVAYSSGRQIEVR